MFKQEVVIKNLPSLQLMMPKSSRHKTPSLEETVDKTGGDIGLGTLFAQNGQQQKI